MLAFLAVLAAAVAALLVVQELDVECSGTPGAGRPGERWFELRRNGLGALSQTP